jgi:urea transport system substrate-binding protein
VTGLALFAEQRIDAPPGAVFALFGVGIGAGWVFDAVCDRVAVGAVVTLQAPLGGRGAERVEILGRISVVRAPSRLEIVHDQPWRGRLRVLFDPLDGPGGRTGTRVRLLADLDETGLEWLMRRRGFRLREDRHPGDHPVGLLASKSGPGSVFASGILNLASMAVEEGWTLGRRAPAAVPRRGRDRGVRAPARRSSPCLCANGH